MRRQRFYWSVGVIGIIATAYSVYSLIYGASRGQGPSALAVVLLILGSVCLVFFVALVISAYLLKKKSQKAEPPKMPEIEKKEEAPEPKEKEQAAVETKKERIVPPNPFEAKREPKNVDKEETTSYAPRPQRSYRYSSGGYASTVYVKLVGYGPVLRINGSRVLDMRRNTYYQIEGNTVMQDGYGPRYEIHGNQIKDVFGGYLYELSGSNINKTFGGYYASVSGNYITVYDLSQKYEMTDSLSKSQILVAAALLFGN